MRWDKGRKLVNLSYRFNLVLTAFLLQIFHITLTYIHIFETLLLIMPYLFRDTISVWYFCLVVLHVPLTGIQ